MKYPQWANHIPLDKEVILAPFGQIAIFECRFDFPRLNHLSIHSVRDLLPRFLVPIHLQSQPDLVILLAQLVCGSNEAAVLCGVVSVHDLREYLKEGACLGLVEVGADPGLASLRLKRYNRPLSAYS